MKCSEIIQELSLYADGATADGMAESIRVHLSSCPLCRQKNADYLQIRSDLRRLKRPQMSLALQQGLKRSLRAELSPARTIHSSGNLGEWLQMRVMPYAVGAVASVVIGFAFLAMMLSGMLRPAQETVRNGRSEPILLARNLTPDERQSIVPAVDFVNSRMAFSSESPSINPEGALMAMTKSLVRGGMKDGEVVVVADVFSNGLAQIAEVVESPSDQRAVAELEKAFRSGSSSPFVPAVMENRPENMRIVLKFQSINVETNQRRGRRRS
jgi:Putative zinc-finger